MQIFFGAHTVNPKVSHREYIRLCHCKFTTFHIPFFIPDVKVSQEIETSTSLCIKGRKKTKGFPFAIVHILWSNMDDDVATVCQDTFTVCKKYIILV